MKKIVIFLTALLLSVNAIAQIPYYAGTVGDGKLYGYTSLKVRPGINHQETYSTFQYGLGDHWATGVDLYTGPDCAYWGGLVRYGMNISKWINIGAEVTSSFDLNSSFKFSYLTSVTPPPPLVMSMLPSTFSILESPLLSLPEFEA